MGMRKLNTEKRAAIIQALVEGNSIAATCRMCGVAKLTVLRLLADMGQLCQDYHDWAVRDLSCERVQCDEIWSFCGCKQRNKERGKQGHGDVWTWTAICSDTKMMVSYLVGSRDAGCAYEFIQDVADRLSSRVQLTTDGLKLYLEAIEHVFGGQIDYAMLVKLYGTDPTEEPHRYSPPKCTGTRSTRISGDPDPSHVSTSYAERSNLTIRMGNRRFTRLTNGFSKKVKNHAYAVALHLFYYNFCRPHMSLTKRAQKKAPTTPAMAVGITDRVWKVTDLVGMLQAEEAKLERGGRINRASRT